MQASRHSFPATIVAIAIAALTVRADNVQIGLNFTGMRSDTPVGTVSSFGSVPDTMGAVGPNHIVELLNGTYSVYNKSTGALVSRVLADDFWTSALSAGAGGSGVATYDPRIIYDSASDRWLACGGNRPVPGDSSTYRIVVGVSNAADPTAGWRAYSVDFDPAHSGSNKSRPDFPRLGVNADGVYVAANMVGGAGSGGQSIFSIPKADLLAAAPTLANSTLFPLVDPNQANNPFITFQPAVSFGPSNGREPGIATFLLRSNILNAAGPGPATLSARDSSAFTVDPDSSDAPQVGGGGLIETGSGLSPRTTVFQQGSKLWLTTATQANSHAAIHWFQIDEPTNQILQSGVISDPLRDLYYPSIAVNARGAVVIGFTGSSSTEYPSAYAVVGQTVGGLTTFGNITLLKAGQDTFHADFTGPVRWGDYSATVPDPMNPQSFWTFQEFTAAKDVWGIQITQILVSDGDYNHNGIVDAADYVVWRKNPGAFPADAYATWRTHFGQTAGNGSEAGANTVPEPGNALMLLMGMLVMCSRRRAGVL